MKKAYFQYYETFENIIEKIKDIEEREHFRKVIIRYGLYGEEPAGLSELEELAWVICKDLIDAQQHRRDTNAENAGAKKTAPAERMKKPTVAEISEYCKAKGYAIDAQHFFNYYEANGWKVGKNAMKSWQATCANWASRDKKTGNIYKSGADAQTTAYENAFN